MRFAKSISWACWTILSSTAAAVACNGGSKEQPEQPSSTNDDGGFASESVATDDSTTNNPDAGVAQPLTSATPVEQAAPTPPACIPDGNVDEPDDDFLDTDCDGIDGVAAQAVFVSPNGSDDSVGDAETPVQTIGKAIEIAVASGKDVYVCNGQYADNVHVTGHGVRIYGGYDCTDGWRRVADHAVVAPASGVALSVENATDGVVIDRIAFRAASAVSASESSVAASIVNSPARLNRVELTSGDGQPGIDGADAADPAYPETPTAGANASNVVGATDCKYIGTSCTSYVPTGDCAQLPALADGPTYTCADGTSLHGGTGGSAANAALTLYGVRWSGPFPGWAGEPAASGLDGQAGEKGTDGVIGEGFGRIEAGKYIAANLGGDGEPGTAGQSGRGGDGATSTCGYINDIEGALVIGGGGGQGGYAGCGGTPGHGGGAGGASIALIIDNSVVELAWSRVITGNGGHGGIATGGIQGQPGASGGLGGTSPEGATYSGKNGGKGGKGGDGGDGGPGGGGPSIGIVHVGQAPTLSDVTFVLGDSGRGALGPHETRGADGIHTEMYAPEG